MVLLIRRPPLIEFQLINFHLMKYIQPEIAAAGNQLPFAIIIFIELSLVRLIMKLKKWGTIARMI
jgi:hypothetical protein